MFNNEGHELHENYSHVKISGGTFSPKKIYGSTILQENVTKK